MTHKDPIHYAYLGLGSNLGDRLANLNATWTRLSTHESIEAISASPVYESKAHLQTGQSSAPDFLNAVLQIETSLAAEDLLAFCLTVERAMGRVRESGKWLPRTVDIDILLFDQQVRADGMLTLPHPRLHERRFVLQPLFDLNPDLHIPPPIDQSVRQLLEDCSDPGEVVRVAETLERHE